MCFVAVVNQAGPAPLAEDLTDVMSAGLWAVGPQGAER